MINLGFTQNEINYAKKIYNEAGGWVPKIAKQILGDNYYMENGDIIKYCVKVLYEDDLFKDAYQYLTKNSQFYEMPQDYIEIIAKHYTKMFRMGRGGKYFYNSDFGQIGIKSIPDYAVCRNLENPFDIYNQGRFIDGTDKYRFIKKGNKESIIRTTRCPYSENEEDIKSSQAKIEKTEYRDKQGNPYYDVKIKNEYLGLLNRFAIFLSLKPPSMHCGCTVSINGAGNKMYIYALEFNDATGKYNKKIENRVGKWDNITTVLGYGFKENELQPMLMKATEYIRKNCDVRLTIVVKPEHNFESHINWLKPLEDTEVDINDLETIDGIQEDNSINLDDFDNFDGIDIDNLLN